MKFADQTGITELITLTKTALKPLETFKNSVTDVNGIVKSNGSGGFSAAVAGRDYAAASHTHTTKQIEGLSSAIADAEPFVVEMTSDSGNVTINKSFSEIKAAFDAGRICYARESKHGIILSLVGFFLHGGVIKATFVISSISKGITVTPHASIEALLVAEDNSIDTISSILQPQIKATGLLKGSGDGNISAAVAGTDYAAADHTHKIEDVNGLDSAMLLKNVSIALPSGTWYDICYGEDRFVAVGEEVIAYSLDGFSWHLATSYPEYTRWALVRYGNGKFIAMPNSAAMVAYSIDGITWTSATLPLSSNNWRSLCYGGGKFVALAGDDRTVYSSDGITWTQGSMPDTSNWCAICYGNGKFVAVNASNKAAYSTNGITWTANKIADNGAYYFITYGELNGIGVFVALQRDSGTWAGSTDGITWHTQFSEGFGANYQIEAITFGNGVFVAQIGYEIGMGFAVLGLKNLEWISTSNSFKSIGTNLFCYGNGLFISGYDSNNSCIFSVDGIEWNDGTRKNIVYPNSKIVTNEVKEVLRLNELQFELKSIQGGYVKKTGTTMTGPLVAQTNTSYTTAQMRNIIISTADPSGGNNGDIWLKYKA